MVIYGELLFAENGIIGGLMLYITGKIHGISFNTRKAIMKLTFGSIMCGVFSFIIFIPIESYLLFPSEIMFAIILCSVVFYDSKKIVLWKKALTFVLTTYFAGGMVMGMLLITDSPGIFTGGGIYTGNMKAGLLAVFITVAVITMRKIIQVIENKKFYSEHDYDVEISFGERNISAKGFVDTGNMLREPISKRPVIIASEELWGHLMNSENADDVQRRFAVIPYKTINENGILKAIRVDCIYINDTTIRNCYIARSDRVFNVQNGRKESDNSYHLLLPAVMIKR